MHGKTGLGVHGLDHSKFTNVTWSVKVHAKSNFLTASKNHQIFRQNPKSQVDPQNRKILGENPEQCKLPAATGQPGRTSGIQGAA